jgi:hypothetical protein
VTITEADELRTGTVVSNGMVYVGREYAGKEVTLAVRVEGPAEDEPEEQADEQLEADD